MITTITRQLSFEDIKPKRKMRYQQILERLITKPQTAKEIAIELFELGLIPSTERNYTAPRLTELADMGLVKVIDLMSEQLTTPLHSKAWVKEYYERKVENGN